MEVELKPISREMRFSFESTKHKLGMQVWGDRRSFMILHEMLSECWHCEDDLMSRAEACSYVGVMASFSFEVRHAFMGDRLVTKDGKKVKTWDDEMFRSFEEDQDRFRVGLELPWSQMLYTMAAWRECLMRKDCPSGVLPVMRDFTENIKRLLQERSKKDYPSIEPFVDGAIYSGNPYLMHAMMGTTYDYLCLSQYRKATLSQLAEMMKYGVYGTDRHKKFVDHLKRNAKRCQCEIVELEFSDDYAEVCDIPL